MAAVRFKSLFLEDLHHQLGLHLFQLFQGRLERLPIVIRRSIEDSGQTKRRVPHQLFGVLHLLAVVGDTHVDLFRILLHQPKGGRGMIAITGAVLLPGELGHLVY